MAVSLDLRERVLSAIATEGLSRRAAARRFAVSIASVVRWKQRVDETGETGPRATGGDQRSAHIERHKGYLLALVRREPDLTLEEIREKLRDRGERFATSVIDRFFVDRVPRSGVASGGATSITGLGREGQATRVGRLTV